MAVSWQNITVSQKTMQRHFFSHPPSPFPGNFCNCNSGGICTASQFLVQLPLLYAAWSDAYSEISLEVMLRPLATFCAKDYKGHSLSQTRFTELPNRKAAGTSKWVLLSRILHWKSSKCKMVCSGDMMITFHGVSWSVQIRNLLKGCLGDNFRSCAGLEA